MRRQTTDDIALFNQTGGGAHRLIQSDSLIQSEPLLGWVLAASPGGEKPGDTASTRGLAPLSKARFASTASETRSGTGYTQAQEGVHPDSVLPLMGHAEYLRSAHWPQGSTWAAGSFPVGNQEVPLIRQAGMGVTNSSPLQGKWPQWLVHHHYNPHTATG